MVGGVVVADCCVVPSHGKIEAIIEAVDQHQPFRLNTEFIGALIGFDYVLGKKAELIVQLGSNKEVKLTECKRICGSCLVAGMPVDVSITMDLQPWSMRFKPSHGGMLVFSFFYLYALICLYTLIRV